MVTFWILATICTALILLSRSRDHYTLQATNAIAHPPWRVHFGRQEIVAKIPLALASRADLIREKVREVQRATGREPSDRRQLRSSDPTYKYKEVTGRRAKIQWWHRVRALVVLSIIIVGLGIALAISVGLVFIAGLLVLESLA
jgi:hypothetical protein